MRLPERIEKLSPERRYVLGLLFFILLGIILTLGLELYLWQSKSVPTRGGEYREAIIGSPRFINPVLAHSDADKDLIKLLYPRLVKYNREGEIIPELAENFEILDGGKTYKFTLRDEAVWEDGTPITAEDVVFTIKTIQDPKYNSPLRQNWTGVEVRKKDRKTVEFSLSSPYAPFLEGAAVGLLPKHIWQKVTPESFPLTEINLRAVGGGPYRFSGLEKNSSGLIASYSLRQNPNYYKKPPFIEQITFRFYENPEEAITAYNKRQVDGLSFISPLNLTKLQRQEVLRLHRLRMPRYFAVFFNASQSKVLEEKSVRQALSYATNRENLLEKILAGYGRKADTPITPYHKSYNKEAAIYSFDLKKAEELLKNSNWRDRDENGIKEKVLSRGREPQFLEFTITTVEQKELLLLAEELQRQWSQIGAQVNIKAMPIGELQQKIIRPRDYEALLFGEILGMTPDPFSFWHSSQKNDPGLNLSLLENTKVDKILEKARKEMDAKERARLYGEFQNLITQDAPAIFLYSPDYLYPVNKAIRGIAEGIIATPSWRFGNVTSWYIETKRVLK